MILDNQQRLQQMKDLRDAILISTEPNVKKHLAMAFIRDVGWLLERAESAESLEEFKQYFLGLKGQNLMVTGWHLNGELEPIETFIEDAVARTEIWED